MSTINNENKRASSLSSKRVRPRSSLTSYPSSPISASRCSAASSRRSKVCRTARRYFSRRVSSGCRLYCHQHRYRCMSCGPKCGLQKRSREHNNQSNRNSEQDCTNSKTNIKSHKGENTRKQRKHKKQRNHGLT